ncbi:MAG: Gfo/Idh/MocA family oxidoreductase [Bacteroidales bacterium]|nr:Gfo/Idh/MocA family oxidoreductase [Bacteroidales bacterium]
MPNPTLSRRGFLAASSAVAAVPFVRSATAGEPSQKVRLAVIGVAARGKANFDGVAHENIVALCEIDEDRAADARRRFPSAAYFTDYRKMLDAVASKVDAVVISTPDHNHALPALIAMDRGKHVYCEKPLAHSVNEVRAMRDAAVKHKVVTQMGTQIHAGDNYRRVVEIVQSGKIGKVKRVHVWCHRQPDAMKKIPTPKPGVKFDTDVWLGPAPAEFFYAAGPSKFPWPHFDWRWWWEFGGGVLADMGCHFTDLPFWALGLKHPTTITAKGTPVAGGDNGSMPATLQVDYQFPATLKQPAVHLTWYHGVAGPDLSGKTTFPGFSDGVLFEGEKAKLVANYGKYRLFPDEFAADFRAPEPTIAKSIGHHREWLEAIRTGGTPLCHFGYAGNLAETVLLGNVAYRAGSPITYDAVTGQVTDVKAANQYLGRPTRKGWEYPV